MPKVATLLAAITVLTSCAIASSTYGPHGKEAFSIDCSGLALNWGKCWEKAGDLCGNRGYEVIGQGGDQGAVASVNPAGGFGGSVMSRSLLVECKD